MILAWGMTVAGCEDGSGDGDGGKTKAGTWSSWADPGSGVTIRHSVAADDVCTITVGGTPANALPGYDNVWKAYAAYSYTATAGITYAYEFEAWTGDGSNRRLTVQWYEDNDKGIYHNSKYDEATLPVFSITANRRTYVLTGTDPIPKSGKQDIKFQCANQTGPFNVRIIAIKPANTDPKMLVIQNVPADFLDGDYKLSESGIGLFPDGTTSAQALAQIDLVAVARFDDSNIATVPSGPNTKTAYIPLYTPPIGGYIRWNGIGNYIIYMYLTSNDNTTKKYFRAGPVNVNSVMTNIVFNSFMEFSFP